MPSDTKTALLGRDTLMREGLRLILSAHGFIVTQSVERAAALSRDSDDDIIVVIEDDHDTGDWADIHALHRRFPAAKLVMLADTMNLQGIMGAFEAGVQGYIVKQTLPDALVGSLRLVAMGERVLPSHLVDALMHRESTPGDSRMIGLAGLSAREREILNCLAMGNPNKVIARQLSISESTVKVHVKAILRKLRVTNRTQAAIHGMNGRTDPHQPHQETGPVSDSA